MTAAIMTFRNEQPRDAAIFSAGVEGAVLATMLTHPESIDGIVDLVSEEDFFEPFFGFMFRVIVREHSFGRRPSPVTIRPTLEKDPAFEELGGWDWLVGLVSGFIVAGIEPARQVVDMARRRRLVEACQQIIAQAQDPELQLGAITADAESALAAVGGDDQGNDEFSGAEALDMVINTFDTPVTGVECGNIPSVDKLLGPMRSQHLVIGAGRPGMGKTATAISYALGAAERGHGVLFYSLEMGAVELGERMAADLCLDQRVAYETIRDRRLDMLQQREVCRARQRLAEMPLQIIDRGGLSIGQIRSRARRWARRFEARGQKLELIIVDYLQLVRADPKLSRYDAVSEISRSLKELAKELGVAVFALAQLSRKVEERADKRPQLSDLRESGQIEQDADAVLFFLRDEYYLRLCEPAEDDPKHDEWQKRLDRCLGRIEFICAKRRNGKTGSLIGDFLYHFQAVRG